jgi:hypothetical protein
MATTNKLVSDKLTKIMAAANRNRRERAKLRDASYDPWQDQERLEAKSVSAEQIRILDQLGVAFDRRPLSDSGTLSCWNAMHLIDEAVKAAKERRERARAEPVSQGQIKALIGFGCEPDDLTDLTKGEASDLIRNFIRAIEARKRA